MIRIAHISDLHFGRDQAALVDPLLRSLTAARPNLVVVSGDFVQRARASQFSQARAFLDRLPARWLAVPGNHDIPLWNLPARLLWPYAGFRQWIDAQREPVHETAATVVLGVDTTDPLSHQRGRIRPAQIARIGAAISREAGHRTVIVAAHHPFHQQPAVAKSLMRGAPEALEQWADCGPHIILSGHLHTWLTEPFLARKGGHQTLQIHAGTGLSTRQRGEPNDFALLDVSGPQVTVTRMQANAEATAFRDIGSIQFRRTTEGWAELGRSDTDPRAETRR